MGNDTPTKTDGLEPVRTRIRRAQFIAGLGFFAAVVGSIFSGTLAIRLLPHLGRWGGVGALLVETALQRAWVIVALPIVCYAAARLVALKPASAAIGAALTGELFHALLDYASLGWGGLYRDAGRFSLRIGSLALGALISMRAIRAARRHSERADAAAQRKAAERKSEYAAFAAEAERLSSRPEGQGAQSGATASSAAPVMPGPTEASGMPTASAPPLTAWDLDTPSEAGMDARDAPPRTSSVVRVEPAREVASRDEGGPSQLPPDTFELDGSLRDIYVQETTPEDWRRVLEHILGGPYDAQLLRDDRTRALPPDVLTLFDEDGTLLRFRCGRVELRCHFFDPSELEFDLDPRTVSGDGDEQALIAFMGRLAELTQKPVDLTPENAPEAPYVRCVQGQPLRVFSGKHL